MKFVSSVSATQRFEAVVQWGKELHVIMPRAVWSWHGKTCAGGVDVELAEPMTQQKYGGTFCAIAPCRLGCTLCQETK
jgi:hypothetical protein